MIRVQQEHVRRQAAQQLTRRAQLGRIRRVERIAQGLERRRHDVAGRLHDDDLPLVFRRDVEEVLPRLDVVLDELGPHGDARGPPVLGHVVVVVLGLRTGRVEELLELLADERPVRDPREVELLDETLVGQRWRELACGRADVVEAGGAALHACHQLLVGRIRVVRPVRDAVAGLVLLDVLRVDVVRPVVHVQRALGGVRGLRCRRRLCRAWRRGRRCARSGRRCCRRSAAAAAGGDEGRHAGKARRGQELPAGDRVRRHPPDDRLDLVLARCHLVLLLPGRPGSSQPHPARMRLASSSHRTTTGSPGPTPGAPPAPAAF